MAFSATVEEGIKVECNVENREGVLDENQIENPDEQDDIKKACENLYRNFKMYEKLYRFPLKKLGEVEIDKENLSTKIDERNRIIGALRYENISLVEKVMSLEANLSQALSQLEQTSNTKLDEMLSVQKSYSDKSLLGYVGSNSILLLLLSHSALM